MLHYGPVETGSTYYSSTVHYYYVICRCLSIFPTTIKQLVEKKLLDGGCAHMARPTNYGDAVATHRATTANSSAGNNA